MSKIKDLPKMWIAMQKQEQNRKINALRKATHMHNITGFNEYLMLQNKILILIIKYQEKIE